MSEKMSEILNDEQLEKVKKILDDIENDATYPFKHMSGAFSRTEIYYIDKDRIDLELIYGISNDIEKRTYSENLSINIETMTVK